MARIELDIDTDLPPERVLSALTDFSDRRPDLWPGLKRDDFKVYVLGETWADVREGSGGFVWARERYDWSTPGRVTWTVVDSGFSSPGDSVSVTATPREGGSRLHVVWLRRGRDLRGRLVVAMVVLMRGRPIRRSVEAGLARIRATPAT